MHPRSKHWHLIDFVITRKPDLQDFKITKALRGAECWTDHRLIRSLVNFVIRPPARKQSKKKQINRSFFHDQSKLDELRDKLSEAIEQSPNPDINFNEDQINENWNLFTEVLYSTTTEVFGFSKKRHQDWFDQNHANIQELLTKKNKAHAALLNSPSNPSLRATFKELRSEAQRILRRMQNEWWYLKAQEIQQYAEQNDQKSLYDAIKASYGPSHSSITPLKSADGRTIIKDQQGILNRWVEYLSELLNHVNPIDPHFADRLPILPPIEHLDATPSFDEVLAACKGMKNNKAAGPDGIPAEVFKFGDLSVIRHLHKMIEVFWEAGYIPQSLKDPIIIMIYKKKGSKTDCANYRGISLLDNAGKVFARVLLVRLLSSVAELILPETQCGFRKDRSTTDMIFVARQLLEKTREQKQDLYFAFVDLAKAFDTINREMLWIVMAKCGCPPKFMEIIKSFHKGMSARVCTGSLISDPFEVSVGVKQGCVLAPTIFNIYLSAITLLARYDLNVEDGIAVNYRLDGSIFNLQRLKARTKTHTTHIFDLQYADDAAYPSSASFSLQRNLNTINNVYTVGGMCVNTDKTEVLHCLFDPANREADALPTFTMGDENLKNVDSFKYLGSILSSSCDLEPEIQNRIRLASASFGRLKGRVFLNRDLTARTKVKVYSAVCLSILLYGSETWTLYRVQVRRLEAFHIRCLQSILGITWRDRIPHVTILQIAHTTSIEYMITTRQLRWVGHVVRMPDNRLPLQILYGELRDGSRSVGGQKKRFKDQLNATLKQGGVPPNQLEALASDRPKWRSVTRQAAETLESSRTNSRIQRRARRHEFQQRGPPPPGDGIQCPVCGRRCASEFGLRSHQRSHQRRQR